jgi:PAS domain S-box-containing protein
MVASYWVISPVAPTAFRGWSPNQPRRHRQLNTDRLESGHYIAFMKRPAGRARRRRSRQLPSQRSLQHIFDVVLDAIITVDAAGRIVSCNAAAERLYGYSTAELIGRHASLLAPPDRREEITEMRRRVASGERIELETERMRKDGTRVPVSLTVSPIHDARGLVVAAALIVRDMTERQLVETALRDSRHQLQALSRRLVEVQEMERTLIARELHDQIGQTLSAVKVNLEALHREIADPALLARVNDGIAAVKRAVEQVQTLSFDLRPSLLDDLGLAAALEAYAKRQTESARLALDLAITVDGQVSKEVEAACFRIVQEAVTNVVRHARAKRLEIDLRTEGSSLQLAVRDDGVGFDARTLQGTAPVEHRLGLVGMSERAQYVGGELEIDSRPGAGTLVCARFPLRVGDPASG